MIARRNDWCRSPVKLVVSRFLLLLLSLSMAVAAPVLWRPANPSVLVIGSGPAPNPPYRFVKEEKGGTNPKVWVRDASGREWIVKWGPEVHSDTFGSRLAAAAGYFAAPVFYVRQGHITGTHNLERAKSEIGKLGEFANARFKLIRPEYHFTPGGWRWDKNPFLASAQGRRQLNGLKILMMLTSNWDGKDARDGSEANTAIFVHGPTQFYAFDDWGATLGSWGHYFTRDKWDCKEFADQDGKFVKGIDKHGFIEWGYSGKHTKDLTEEITPEDAAWILARLQAIGRARMQAGLRASGATPKVATCLAWSLQDRILQLRDIVRLSRQIHGRR